LIEKTAIILSYQKKTLNIENKNILNINFSIAFYETLLTLINTFKHERDKYSRKKNSDQSGKNNKRTDKKRKNNEFGQSMFNIKNNTGELLLFKTSL
jgi:hypothetical protein